MNPRAAEGSPAQLPTYSSASEMASEFITALRGKEEQQRRSGGPRASLLSPVTVYLLIGALLLGALITMSPALVHRSELGRRRRCRRADCDSPAAPCQACSSPSQSTLLLPPQEMTSRRSQSCCPA